MSRDAGRMMWRMLGEPIPVIVSKLAIDPLAKPSVWARPIAPETDRSKVSPVGFRRVSIPEARQLARRVGSFVMWRPDRNLPDAEQYCLVAGEHGAAGFMSRALDSSQREEQQQSN